MKISNTRLIFTLLECSFLNNIRVKFIDDYYWVWPFLPILVFSHFDGIFCDGTEGVFMYVCVYMRVCVRVWKLYIPNGRVDFDETFYK